MWTPVSVYPLFLDDKVENMEIKVTLADPLTIVGGTLTSSITLTSNLYYIILITISTLKLYFTFPLPLDRENLQLQSL